MLNEADIALINSIDADIPERICAALGCTPESLNDFTHMTGGLSNISLRFSCLGTQYIYRHPGAGMEELVNRLSEKRNNEIAAKMGLDNLYITMDGEKGWKLSRFMENARIMDYHHMDEVAQAMSMIRKLHTAAIRSTQDFDLITETHKILGLIRDYSICKEDDFSDLLIRMKRLWEFALSDGVEPVLCHCDFYSPNLLFGDDDTKALIDWEYSGNSDPASDLGTFICCSDYTFEESMEVLRHYFGRELSGEEERHYLGYVSIAGYYWYVWSLYRTACGGDMGDWTALWRKFAEEYGAIALKLYENEEAFNL